MEESSIGIAAIIVSAIVAYLVAKMTNYSKDVVQERQKWRSEIRDMTVDAVTIILHDRTNSADYRELITNFCVRLNPNDHRDMEIIEALNCAILNPSDILAKKIQAMSSRLLKHDWERAKYESSILSTPAILFKTKPNEADIRRLRSYDYLTFKKSSRDSEDDS